MIAYEKGLDWQELFELAQTEDAEMDEEAIADMAYRVAGAQVSRRGVNVTDARIFHRGPVVEEAVCRSWHGIARLHAECAGNCHCAGAGKCFLGSKEDSELRLRARVSIQLTNWLRSACIQSQVWWRRLSTRPHWKVERRYLRTSVRCENN